MRFIAIIAALFLGFAATIAGTEASLGAMHRSCGYHCTPDGKFTTAAPPKTAEVQLVRANIHSGGRTGGFANKRVGCGGCQGHPASSTVHPGVTEPLYY